jgi:hypothetical protein
MPKSKSKPKAKAEAIRGTNYKKGMIQCPVCFGNDNFCETCKGEGQVKE